MFLNSFKLKFYIFKKLNDNKNKILLNNYSFDTKKKSNVEEKNKILFDKIYTFHPEINKKFNVNILIKNKLKVI